MSISPSLVTLAALLTASTSSAAALAQDAPPPPAAAADHPADEAPARKIRVGALVGVGFPRPLAAEALVKLGPYVAIGAEYGGLPTSTFGAVSLTAWSVSGDVRVFPFKGPFFVGLRAGRQHVDANATVDVPVVGSLSEALAFDSWFLNPRIGFLWTLDWGLTFGLDAGLQVPVSGTTTSSQPLGLVPSVQSTVNAIGGPMPTIDLVRIGMLF